MFVSHCIIMWFLTNSAIQWKNFDLNIGYALGDRGARYSQLNVASNMDDDKNYIFDITQTLKAYAGMAGTLRKS